VPAFDSPKLMQLRQVHGAWKIIARYDLLGGSAGVDFASGCSEAK
jgi:hypothetical protein